MKTGWKLEWNGMDEGSNKQNTLETVYVVK